MDNLNFGSMDDDLFRKDFLNFLNQHQKRMSDFMKKMYGDNNLNSGQSFDEIMSRLNITPNNIERGEDEYGTWENSEWFSNDGNTHYNSFFREFNPYKDIKPRSKTQEISTLDLLESKLNKSILEEDYESAAKIRDLMKSLSED
tara:strand:+ start:13783 stop:14214 length:432 start_codon:yes stop_codon:yes gene_type:complete